MENRTEPVIIFEDNSIIIISKPAGMLTIPDRFNPKIPNLRNYLINKYGEIFIVHRLDKDTSGIMVFTKTAEAHRKLNQQFQDQTVKRLYHVVVAGVVHQNEIKIDIPLIADPAKVGQTKPSARGKESLTILRVMNRFRNASLVECDLVTGRHHQIRVHCAAIGHPLLVDEIYGTSSEFFVSSIKKRFNLKKHEEEKPIITRVSMHAHSLSFIHPDTDSQVTYTSDEPKDFRALISVLKKYSSLPDYYI